MSNKKDYPVLAKKIIAAVGGKDNINLAWHCATRVRFELKKEPEDAIEKVNALPGVITTVKNNGQFQIVIGTSVANLFDKMTPYLNKSTLGDSSDSDEEGSSEKGSILNRVISTMSAVFAPFIYILAAAGILQGILIIAGIINSDVQTTGTYRIFNLISWAPFVFLPIFIAVTASKHFKTNMYIALACCAALVSPDMAVITSEVAKGHAVNFLNFPLSQTTYTSSVLPPIILVWFLSYLERWLNKKIPEVVRSLFVPFLSLVIMVPLTLLVLGPVSSSLATGLASGYNWIVKVAPPIAGMLVGGLFQIIVIFGVHWGVTPMVMANFQMHGHDSFQLFQTMSVLGQMGAVFGVFLKSRNKEIKKVSISAFITSIFGITEPTVYGVTLRFKKPFIFACIAGASGGLVASLFNPSYYAYAGLPGMLTLVNAYNKSNPNSIIGAVLGAVISLGVALLLVLFFGTGENKLNDKIADEEIEGKPVTKPLTDDVVYSPLSGKVIPMEKIKDPFFASGAMGKGVAIDPQEGELYAPFDGTIILTYKTKHAIGLRSDNGVELLIHIGMDTVKLNGEGFETHVQENQHVKKGDLITSFDISRLREEGYDVTTPLVVTNWDKYSEFDMLSKSSVNHGDELFAVDVHEVAAVKPEEAK